MLTMRFISVGERGRAWMGKETAFTEENVASSVEMSCSLLAARDPAIKVDFILS